MSWNVAIYHINVNAGDAAIIVATNGQTGERSTVLVDAGTGIAGKNRVLSILQQLQIPHINAIVITHYDNDHLGGLNTLLKSKVFQTMLSNTRLYDTGKFENDTQGVSAAFSPNQAYSKLQRSIEALANTNTIIHCTNFDDLSEVRGLEIFWSTATGPLQDTMTTGSLSDLIDEPVNSPATGKPGLFCIACNKNTVEGGVIKKSSADHTTDINQRSIALIVTSDAGEILHYLGGDLGISVENQLLPWLVHNATPPIPVMKLSHHGSKYSTPLTTQTPPHDRGDFLSQLQPQNIILSSGNNRYGHPAIDILAGIADRLGSKTTLLSTNYPEYLQDQAMFDTYVTDHFRSSAQTDLLSKLSPKGVVTAAINDIISNSSGTSLTSAQKIWISCYAFPQAYSYWPTQKLPPLGSQYVQVTLLQQSTPLYLVTATNDDGVVIKKSKPSTMIVSMATPDSSCKLWAWPSNAPESPPNSPQDILLTTDSDLYKFIYQLKTKCLVIDTAPNISGSSWDITNGVIDLTQDLGQWFSYCGIQNFTISLQGTMIDGFLNYDSATLTFTASLDLTESVSLSGSLQPYFSPGNPEPNYSLVFTLPQSSSISLANGAQFVGFLEENSVLLPIISGWLPSGTTPSIELATQTNFKFTASPDYRLSLDLISNPLTNALSVHGFGLSDMAFVFSQNVVPALDGTPSGISKGEFTATLTVAQSMISITVLLSPLGTGIMRIEPAVVSDITTLITNLISTASMPNFLSSLSSFGCDLDATAEIILNMDFSSATVNSIILKNSFSFNGLSLDAQVLLPQNIISASLSAPTSLHSDLLEASSTIEYETEDSSEEDTVGADSTPDPSSFGSEIGPSSSFQTFSNPTSGNATALALDDNALNVPTFSLPAEFPSFNLVDFNFVANLQDKSYQCSGNLMSSDGLSIWEIPMPSLKLKLEDWSFSLGASGSDVEISLEACLGIGSQWAIVSGAYDSSKSADPSNGWQFTAIISELNLSDVFFFVDPNLRLPMSDCLLSNIHITLSLDTDNESFSLSANTPFGGLVLVTGADGVIFGLALPSMNNLSLPVIGVLPPIIDSLQLFYVSQSIQATDPIVSAFQTACTQATARNTGIPTTMMPTLVVPTAGLAAGLQILIEFCPILGQSTMIPTPLLIWTPSTVPPASVAAETPRSSLSQTSSDSPAETLWISINRTIGSMLLSQLGLSFHDQQFYCLFDAAIMIGELTLELEDLAISFALNTPNQISVSLSGLGLDYHDSAVSILGDFLKNQSTTLTSYQGVASLTMEELMVAAMGSYAQTSTGSQSVFVYARVNEPLGGPPFFYVMGFAGGFGYNQQLRIPTLDQVLQFPLVSGAMNQAPVDISNDMSSMMAALTNSDNPWITPSNGSEWFAVGVNFTTFELMNTNALVVAELGATNPEFSLIGLSSILLPQGTTDSVAYANMGMEAVYNPDVGSLCTSAVLSPNSYVLSPDCHLTGGFAFYTWFKNQAAGPQAGDFALTLGGYHPSFSPPAWYPNVSRLGFNWMVDSQVTINGDAYFAITPSSIMMGGALNASFNAGDLKAWFNASSDFLIHWRPFDYEADIGVSVGASYHLKLWFCTTTITAEIGATLHLEGPPTYGNVYVDWHIISFSIPFGEKVTATPPVDWSDFCYLLPTNPTSSTVSLNRIMIATGLFQQNPNTSTWTVRPNHFSFYTLSAIPLTSVTFNGAQVVDSEGKTAPDDEVNIKPMGLPNITYTHAVTVNPQNPGWTCTLNTGNVPDALWGVPEQNLTLNSSLLPNRWTGLTLSAPPATAGATPGPMSTDIFEDACVHSASLPLTESSSSPVPQVNVSNSRQIIASTIAANNNTRNQVVSSLSILGIFKTPPTLDPMTIMAQKISDGQCLAEPPLQISSLDYNM